MRLHQEQQQYLYSKVTGNCNLLRRKDEQNEKFYRSIVKSITIFLRISN